MDNNLILEPLADAALQGALRVLQDTIDMQVDDRLHSVRASMEHTRSCIRDAMDAVERGDA